MNLGHCIDGAAAGKPKPDPKFSAYLPWWSLGPGVSFGAFLFPQKLRQLRNVGSYPPRLIARE
jgi:hypothetical protein